MDGVSLKIFYFFGIPVPWFLVLCVFEYVSHLFLGISFVILSSKCCVIESGVAGSALHTDLLSEHLSMVSVGPDKCVGMT